MRFADIGSYDMGVISSKSSISVLDKLTASAFCRRRFAVILVRLKMAETIKEAATFIEQGRTLLAQSAALTLSKMSA